MNTKIRREKLLLLWWIVPVVSVWRQGLSIISPLQLWNKVVEHWQDEIRPAYNDKHGDSFNKTTESVYDRSTAWIDHTNCQQWTRTSGVSAGHIIPHWVLCSCRGRASFPSRPTGEFRRRRCDSVDANVSRFSTCRGQHSTNSSLFVFHWIVEKQTI